MWSSGLAGKSIGLLLASIACGFGQGTHLNTIQFDIGNILNARPVTTFNNACLTTWKTGIDGGGNGDGYLTRSAATYNGDQPNHALPDESLIPANAGHPAIQLHYSNRDSLHYQACSMRGDTSVTFPVPKGKYKMLYFAMTSAEGASSLIFKLTYANGETTEQLVLPDYYQDLPPNAPSLCYLVHDLAKWGPANKMTEKDHHNIDLVKIKCDVRRYLSGITISKGSKGYVVVWAAAGQSGV